MAVTLSPEQQAAALLRIRVELATAAQVATGDVRTAFLEMLRDTLAILPPNEVINLGSAVLAKDDISSEPIPRATIADVELVERSVAGVADAHGEEQLSKDAILCVVMAAAVDVRVEEALRRMVDEAASSRSAPCAADGWRPVAKSKRRRPVAVIPQPNRRPHTIGEVLACHHLERQGGARSGHEYGAHERQLAEDIDGAIATVWIRLAPKTSVRDVYAVLDKIVRAHGGAPVR